MFWTTDRDGNVVRKYYPNGTLVLELGMFGEFVYASDLKPRRHLD